MAAQDELLRLALVDTGAEAAGRWEVVPDPARRRPGRGAYVHERAACAELALAPGALAKAFRVPVTPGGETLEWIDQWRESASRT